MLNWNDHDFNKLDASREWQSSGAICVESQRKLSLFFPDMKSLPTWPVTLVLATWISVAIGTSSYLLRSDVR